LRERKPELPFVSWDSYLLVGLLVAQNKLCTIALVEFVNVHQQIHNIKTLDLLVFAKPTINHLLEGELNFGEHWHEFFLSFFLSLSPHDGFCKLIALALLPPPSLSFAPYWIGLHCLLVKAFDNIFTIT
jgi:hypothetical protein